MFSGTVRDNLDPFNACDGDAAVWSALRQTGMAATVKGLKVGFQMLQRVHHTRLPPVRLVAAAS